MRKLILFSLLCIFFNAAKATDSTFYFTTSDSVKLFVRVAGNGEPCLFVHGGPGSTSYYFEAMPSAKLLEKELKMIYFDQRGSGRSDSSMIGNYGIERMSKDIEELKSFLAINKWHVMGHSFAGIILTDYALSYPRSINSLMYINATLNIKSSMQSHLDFGVKELGLHDDTLLANTNIPVEQRVWKVHEKLTEKDMWYKLMYRNAFEKKLNDSVTMMIGKFNRDFANKVWGIAEYSKDYTKETPKILHRALVMTGERDYAIGINHYKTFNFPNKQVVHYIGGHAPFQEEPQWFAEKVLAFVHSAKK